MLHIEFLHERFEANLVTSIYKKVACNFLEPLINRQWHVGSKRYILKKYMYIYKLSLTIKYANV